MGVDGFIEGEELNRELLLGLDGASVSLLLIPNHNSQAAYQFYSGFPILLDGERIGDVQTTLGILEKEECLVWSLCGASFLCSQDDAQCIGAGEYNGFGQRLG